MAVQSGVYRGVSAHQRAAARRERLLEATLAVWGDAGTRTTMTAVCAQAGLTERYFYESFAGLEEAQLAVLDRIATEVEDRTRAAAEAAAGDVETQVRASVLAFVELLTEDPRRGRVAIVEAVGVPALRRRRTELLRHFAHRAAETAQLAGLPTRGRADAEVAGLLFVGGMAELITAWLDGVSPAAPENVVEAATRMFLGLYA